MLVETHRLKRVRAGGTVEFVGPDEWARAAERKKASEWAATGERHGCGGRWQRRSRLCLGV